MIKEKSCYHFLLAVLIKFIATTPLAPRFETLFPHKGNHANR